MLLLLFIGVGIQQKEAFSRPVVNNDFSQIESSILSSSQSIKKYFGNEVFGDLNNDKKEDVAFLIKRDDEGADKYYLSASLKTTEGYSGLNLLYVGENISIENIAIENQVITILYKELISNENADEQEIKTYKAKFTEDSLWEFTLEDYEKNKIEDVSIE